MTNRVGTDRKHLGSGLFRCAVCDSPVRSHTGNRYRCPEGHLVRMAPSIDDFVLDVARARLARPDLADLLVPQDDHEVQVLGEKINVLRARLARVEDDYDAGLIDGRRFAVATEKVRAELRAAETARARLGGAGAARLLTVDDPSTVFDDAPLGTKRELLDLLLVVRLHPTQRGRKFDPTDGSVAIEWRAA